MKSEWWMTARSKQEQKTDSCLILEEDPNPRSNTGLSKVNSPNRLSMFYYDGERVDWAWNERSPPGFK